MSAPDFQLYPDEQDKIKHVLDKLATFEFGKGDADDKRLFEMAAHNEFGEIGLEVNVTWQEIYRESPFAEAGVGIPTGVYLPQVEIAGRVKPESETDHDRFQWGVVKGLADGQPGYVREDGSRREDPIKKIILPKGNS